MSRWGMVIDRKKCIGCYACMIACKQSHAIRPGIFWSRVLIGEIGNYPTVTKKILPVLCNHCKDAPCIEVCPTGATYKRDDGIVMVDYYKCVGCRSCLIACPYQMRSFNENGSQGFWPESSLTELEMAGNEIYPIENSVVVKCNFCVERLEEGLSKGLEPGKDWEASPVCVNACPVGARVFGDLEDPNNEISRIIKERKGYQLHPEYDTNPSVFYVD